MKIILSALVALAFGGVAIYALLRGYVPIRPNLKLRRATHPVGYWLMVSFHATLGILSAVLVYLEIREMLF